ncbi:MAG: AraC family transcriptional regulator [Halieaceae bacterium]|jgi:AraC-like DNA-binding protein|nr:AraC family transcriptional regulator [Halieaceae bacterium]
MLIHSDRHLAGFGHRAYGLGPFISLMKEEGLNARPLLEECGIPPGALEDPDYTLTADRELYFMESALAALQKPDLGLRCGPRYHLSFYGMLGLAAMTSTNLTEAFRVVFKYLPMTWSYMFWSLRTDNGLAVISLEPQRDLGGCYQYMVDRGLAASYTIACDALGFAPPLVEVNVRQPEPSYGQLYRDIFKCPVNFGMPENDFRMEEHYISLPLQQAESESARIFAAQCEQICANLVSKGSFAEVIRQHLLQLPNQMASLESIAGRLHMTPRTIQRKLTSEKTSYLELVENVRRNLAVEYLKTTALTMDEIAVRLGYADAPSFSHAFKRWTGVSPGSMREHGSPMPARSA